MLRRPGRCVACFAFRRIPHARAAGPRLASARPRLEKAAPALSAVVRAAAVASGPGTPPPAVALRPLDCGPAVILLVNPRATHPRNRRFPLSVMAIGAALPEDKSWEIVDGNLPGADPFATICAHVERQAGGADPVEAIAMTVMPGPQLVSAVPLSRQVKARFPAVPIVWGGNFGSLYPAPVLNAPYVDWLVRGLGVVF